MNQWLLACGVFLLFLQGCASTSHSVDSSTDEAEGSVVDQGPVLAENADVQTKTIEATAQPPAESEKDLNCIVLGAGMAKAFAEVGVLEGLQDQLKDFNCVVGVEMGAVIGALYADKRNVNAVKWQLYKLKRELYLDLGFMSFGDPHAAGKKLHHFFTEIFGTRSAKDLGIRFVAVYLEHQSNVPLVREDLPLADVLSASVALPGVFKPWKFVDGHLYSSAAEQSAVPVEIAQGLGAKKLIVVDVLDEQAPSSGLNGVEEEITKSFVPISKLARVQTEGTPLLIKPDTRGYQYWDFQKQQELFDHGRQAAQDFLQKQMSEDKKP